MFTLDFKQSKVSRSKKPPRDLLATSIKENRLFRWIAGMLSMDYPMPLIFKMISKSSKKSETWCDYVSFLLQDGMNLSEAIRFNRFSKIPAMHEAFIETGEKHNNLSKSMIIACELEEKIRLKDLTTITQNFRSYIIYLFFIVPFSIFSLFIIRIFITPVFEEMFIGYNSQLPEFILLINNILGWTKSNIPNFFKAALLLFVGYSFSSFWIRRWQILTRLLEMLPLFGRPLLYSRYWKMSYGIGSLMKINIPIDEAIATVGKGLQMPPLITASKRIREQVRQGNDLIEIFKKELLFPPEFQWLAFSAETKNNFPDLLIKQGIIYQNLYIRSLIVAQSAISILILIFSFVFIIFIVASVYIPIFGVSRLI